MARTQGHAPTAIPVSNRATFATDPYSSGVPTDSRGGSGSSSRPSRTSDPCLGAFSKRRGLERGPATGARAVERSSSHLEARQYGTTDSSSVVGFPQRERRQSEGVAFRPSCPRVTSSRVAEPHTTSEESAMLSSPIPSIERSPIPRVRLRPKSTSGWRRLPIAGGVFLGSCVDLSGRRASARPQRAGSVQYLCATPLVASVRGLALAKDLRSARCHPSSCIAWGPRSSIHS